MLVTASLNLDLRRMLILASMSARIWMREMDFLLSLDCHTSNSTWERVQMKGNSMGSSMGKFREIMSSFLQLGTTLWVNPTTQSLTPEL